MVSNRLRRLGVALLLSLPTGTPLLAQADSITRHRLWTWKDAAILEGFAIMTVAIAPLDQRIARRLQDATVQENRSMQRGSEFVRSVADPGSVVIGVGLYTYGRLAHSLKAADLGLHGTEALLLGAEVGNLLKGIIGRARPALDVTRPHDYQTFRGFRQGGDYQSFPSGHTIAAFAAASAVTSETHRWWPKSVWVIGPTMYGGASAVAFSRMFNNRHWASDVIAGAAIGTFAGLKVVQWQHTHPGNRLDRFFLGALVGPGPEGTTVLKLNFAPKF
jgi:membrane-associated phospholipid phosphatase